MMKWSPFKYLTPVEFPDVDCRFYHVKFDRISVCDQYADIVLFSKASKDTGRRIECEFAENYVLEKT